MTKISLTAAAILISASNAFAGSDKFGSTNASQPTVASVDNTITTSIETSDVEKPVVQAATATSWAIADRASRAVHEIPDQECLK
jgi:hypothetical protein